MSAQPNTIHQFRDAIRAAGLTPPDEIEPDGKLQRFSSSGRRDDDSGFYVLHDDKVPAGHFGDWRTGISTNWTADIGQHHHFSCLNRSCHIDLLGISRVC